MNNTFRFLIALAVAAPCAVAFTSSVAHAQANSTKIRLSGPAIAGIKSEGKSEYRADARRRSFRVEGRLNLANGTVLTALVNGVSVGTVSVTAGIASLEVSTERGGVVPAIRAGDRVSVVNAAGAVVLSGSF